MRRILIIVTIMLANAMHAGAQGAQMQWREGSPEINIPSLVDPRQTDGVEIYGKDCSIIVKTPHRIQIKVFTILGQQVSQAIIGPGSSTLRINAHGIYIVKIGSITQKVVL